MKRLLRGRVLWMALGLTLWGILVSAGWAQNGTPPPQDDSPKAASASADKLRTVNIRFFEKGTGVPLQRVEVKFSGNVAFSNDKGTVELSFPEGAEGTLKISRRGYQNATLDLDQLREVDEHDFYLYPAITGDDVVIVRGERRTTISRKTITAEESRKIAPGGDPAQVVKLLPGVQAGGFRPQVVVRGSGPDDSRYYIDDLEVPFIFHEIGSLSLVPPPMLSEVQFDSGGFGPEFGDATGGVVVLNTTTEIPERPKTRFVTNVPLYSGVYHTRPLGESSSVSMSFRRSYIDTVAQFVLEQQREEGDEGSGGLRVAPYFTDAHLVYTKKHEGGHTKLSLIGADDGMEALFPADFATGEDGKAGFSLRTRFLTLGVERMDRLNTDWKYRSTPQVFYQDTNNNFIDNEMKFTTTRYRFPAEFVRRLSADEDFIFGLDYSHTEFTTDYQAIKPNFEDPTFDFEDAPRISITDTERFQEVGAWVSVDQMVGDLKLTPGVRGFYNEMIDKVSADPRLRSVYELTPKQKLKAAVGQYSKAPQPQEASKNFGNPDLEYEKSVHYVLGWDARWTQVWNTEIQLFYKEAYDAVTFDREEEYDNDASYLSRGAELFVRRNPTARLFGWLSYTYSRTQERESDQQTYRAAEHDQNHVVNLVGNYRIFANWNLGGRYNHHTGDTYTPIEKGVYNANLDKYQPRKDEDAENSARLPDYNSLALYSSHDFLFDTWKMTFKWGVESYWFEPQVLGVTHNYDYSKKRYQKGLGTIPFVEVRGEL